MVGGVVWQFLRTKSTWDVEISQNEALSQYSSAKKYGYRMYTTTDIMRINFSEPQVPKGSRFIHRLMFLSTVLLFKLPLYESHKIGHGIVQGKM